MDLGSVEGVTVDTLVSFLSCQDSAAAEDGSSAGPTLVVDCRPFMAFNTGHILEAVNVHCPPIVKRRSGGFVALENIVVDEKKRGRLQRGEYGRLVVYDQSTDHLPSADDRESNLYSVLKSLGQQLPLLKVFYLLGGYDAFSQDCPLLCVTQQFSPLSTGRLEAPQPQETANACGVRNVLGGRDEDDHPVEILPHLLLGSGQHASRLGTLQRLGVTAVVNASTSCPNHFPAAFRYLHIPVHDSASEDLASWFPTANQFIDEVQAEGGRVLVHCQAGRSRSATVCLAYLIRTLDLSLDAAFEHVRSRRQVIDPNLNFMQQLQSYRQRLDAERGSSRCPAPPPPAADTTTTAAAAPAAGNDQASSFSLPAACLSSTPSLSSSSSVWASLPCSQSSQSPGPAFTFSGSFSLSGSSPVPSLSLSSSSAGFGALPSLSLPHMEEAAAPITLPSAARESSSSSGSSGGGGGGGLPPAFSSAAADLSLPSPATANDVHYCFFDFSSTEFAFPSSSLARTPEIPLPS